MIEEITNSLRKMAVNRQKREIRKHNRMVKREQRKMGKEADRRKWASLAASAYGDRDEDDSRNLADRQPSREEAERDVALINHAIEAGLERISEYLPKPRGDIDYLKRHLSKGRERLQERIDAIVGYLGQEGQQLSQQEKEQFIYHHVKMYVESGAAFDKDIQKDLIRRGLESDLETIARAGSGHHRTRRAGGQEGEAGNEERDNYLVSLLSAVHRAGKVLERKGAYEAQKDREFLTAIYEIRHGGLMEAAFETFEERGLIPKGKSEYMLERMEQTMKRADAEAFKNANETLQGREVSHNRQAYHRGDRGDRGQGRYSGGSEQRNRMGDRYVHARRAVSSAILAIFGALTLILTGTGITGNVVGNSSVINASVFGWSLGVLLLALSALVVLKKK